MSKLSLTLCTFSVTSSVASLFLTFGLQRNSLKNILDPMKSLPSLVYYYSPSTFQSLCTLFIQSSMCPCLNLLCSTLSLREHNWSLLQL